MSSFLTQVEENVNVRRLFNEHSSIWVLHWVLIWSTLAHYDGIFPYNFFAEKFGNGRFWQNFAKFYCPLKIPEWQIDSAISATRVASWLTH